MKQIKDLIIEKEDSKITNKRQYVLSLILEEINKERAGTKWKPITPAYLGVKLSHLSEFDLWHMLSVGKDYKERGKPFGMYLFGSLKNK